jgi:PhzF family phenazine biosynthesis protein
MTSRRFSQVDVFTRVPTLGNPVAVVHDADGLSEEQMAAVARWTNLSETTFLLSPEDPEADYRVRIFTTSGELPFAGHPTLGSAVAWLRAGGAPADPALVVQECGVGLVDVRAEARPAFAAPPLRRSGPVDSRELTEILAAAGTPREVVVGAAWVDNGPGWIGIELRSVDDVLAVRPDPARTAGLKLGLVARYADDDPRRDGRDVEVRGFFDGGAGLFEDPVTGSLNAGLAQWLIGAGRLPLAYVAGQGQVLQRDGRVHVEQDGERIWVGGDVAAVVTGEIELDDR